LEAGRRLEKLVQRAADPLLAGERLRAVRAIELLEHIGTPEARALLAAVASGAAGARRTEEARESANRLAALGVGLPQCRRPVCLRRLSHAPPCGDQSKGRTPTQ